MNSVLAWSTICVVLTIFLVNGLLMLISPERWFGLPKWMSMRGSLSREMFSTGPASLGVRMAGGLLVAAVGFFLYVLFARG